MGSLSVYIPFTSSSLIVSNFAVCDIPFLAGFYSRDFILEMFSMRYVNMFGFVLLFMSTGNIFLKMRMLKTNLVETRHAVCVNITLRRVRATIFALEKQ
jgi:NADH:ubiquinone oxidoreductase subunit 5 (subunit L)/multisubunit Na+/H+ antiporter MnhA subunit